MPFTFAHPAIILPLTRLNKKYSSATALIIGSITPDFECFIRMKAKSIYSHTFWGILYFDVPVAIIIFLIWNVLVKHTLLNNLSPFLQRRFNNESKIQNNCFTVMISLAVGIFSHLFWDSFTHSNGYFVAHSSMLQNVYHFTYGDITLYEIIRNISGIAGVLVLIYALWNLPSKYTIGKGDKWYWPLVGFTITLTIFIRCIVPHKVLSLGDYFSTFTAGLFIGIITASIISEKIKIKLHRYE